MQPWRPSLSTSVTDLWDSIADGAGRESPLWAAAARDDLDRQPVFSLLCDDAYALGLETIYEGYLCHYGRPRLFAPADAELGLLLGERPRADRGHGQRERRCGARGADLDLLAPACRARERRRGGMAGSGSRPRTATA